MEATKQQRSEGKSKGLGWVILAALILVCTLALTGCSVTPTLDKAVNTCFALEGSPSYTKSEGVEKFSCDRPSVSTVKVSR